MKALSRATAFPSRESQSRGAPETLETVRTFGRTGSVHETMTATRLKSVSTTPAPGCGRSARYLPGAPADLRVEGGV